MAVFHFILDRLICISGQSVEGRVLLDFRAMQSENTTVDEVIVKLKGDMKVASHKIYVRLTRQSKRVWRRGNAYPPAGSDNLIIPVSFPLPQGLPSSCHIHKWDLNFEVAYQIEAVGVRSGVFHTDTHIKHPVTVLPSRRMDASTVTQLRNGWEGELTTRGTRKHVDKRMTWGGRAEIEMQLSLPKVPAMPITTAIRFSLSATTFSEPCLNDETTTLWVNPPSHLQELELILEQACRIKGGKINIVMIPLTLGESEIVQVDKEWLQLAGHPQKGRWRQETIIKSSFTLRCPPSFIFRDKSTEFQVSYVVRVKVHFSAKHDLVLDTPVDVVRDI